MSVQLLQEIGVSVGAFLGMILFSVVLVYLQITYVDPWRLRVKWRRRLRGMHLVTTNKSLSELEYPEDKCMRHWFTDEVSLWCYDNCSGKYGCVPLFDKGVTDYLGHNRKNEPRQFFFEKPEEALMFKLIWC